MKIPFWGRKSELPNNKKMAIINLLSGIIGAQQAFSGRKNLENGFGEINRKAVGYIYGMVDAAFTVADQKK